MNILTAKRIEWFSPNYLDRRQNRGGIRTRRVGNFHQDSFAIDESVDESSEEIDVVDTSTDDEVLDVGMDTTDDAPGIDAAIDVEPPPVYQVDSSDSESVSEEQSQSAIETSVNDESTPRFERVQPSIENTLRTTELDEVSIDELIHP